MRITRSTLILGTALFVGCNSSQAPSPPPTAALPFSNQATTAQLMSWILDPQADIVWAVGGSIITSEGETKLDPKNDSEWNAVRNAAATVAETGNLLMLEGRARDHEDWLKMARLMIDKANECVQAAETKDVDAVFTAGGDLYLACTACHTKYVIGASAKSENASK